MFADIQQASLFLKASVIFACGWILVVLLYLIKVVPVIKRRRGIRTLIEAAFQLNFSGHVKEYGRIAKEENNQTMLTIYYSLNVLVVLSVIALLGGLLSMIVTP
jgi:hypothetical protein